MTQAEQDHVLIEQLKVNEQQAYISLYRLYYPDLARYILRNSGSKEDAEDVFQETLLILLHKVRTENFVLQSELKTFLFAINRNQWLKKLRSNKKTIPVDLLENTAHTFEESFDINLSDQLEPANWVQRLFENITGHCVVLITRIFLRQQEPKDLIKELGYKNSHTFQNQKYKCINQLRKAGKKFPFVG